MKHLFISLLVLSIISISCNKNKIEPSNAPKLEVEEEPPPVQPKVIFQTASAGDAEVSELGALWHHPYIIYGKFDDFESNGLTIIAIDIRTKEVVWEWDDFATNRAYVFSHDVIIAEDKLVISNEGYLYCLDIKTGKEVWRTANLGFERPPTYFDGFIWASGFDNYNKDGFIYKVNLNDGEANKVFGIPFHEDNSVEITSIRVVENDSNEILLYFQNRGRSTLIGYNVTTKKQLFEIDLDVKTSTNSKAPWHYNNKLYMMDNVDLYCLDAVTGEILWKNNYNILGAGLITTIPYFKDGIIYFHFGGTGMRMIDAETGKQLYWYEHAGNTSNMVEMRDKLCYTSWADGDLHCVDSKTGAMIYSSPSPNDDKYGDGNYSDALISGDSKRNLVFTTDFYSLIVWRLPEE